MFDLTTDDVPAINEVPTQDARETCFHLATVLRQGAVAGEIVCGRAGRRVVGSLTVSELLLVTDYLAAIEEFWFEGSERLPGSDLVVLWSAADDGR